jgi:hypothetical protein
MKYQIGDEAWWAKFENTETSIECPHCGGTGQVLVTFHDETTVSVECQNCSRGYNPPTGRVVVYDRTAKAELVTISGVELRAGKTPEYRAADGPSSSWIIDENRLFRTREEAMKCAEGLAEQADKEERAKVSLKEKDTRSWAWNATYHRNQIKHAKKEIAYHESKLAVASLKAKEPA